MYRLKFACKDFLVKAENFCNKMKSLRYPELFKEKLIYAYALASGEHLSALLNEVQEERLEKQIEDLKGFLKKNWLFIQGSLLSYTALPRHELTLLLCELAEALTDIENQQKRTSFEARPLGVLEILMPGVALESLFPAEYRHLYPILSLNAQQERKWEDIKLPYLLRTTILGRDNSYLIPIKYLAKYPLEKDFIRKGNPYFDLACHKVELARLNAEEYQRLLDHSTCTRALGFAQLQYDLIARDQSNFLGQLNYLIKAMEQNSIHGLGSEEFAGENVYVALSKFMTYYQHLDEKNSEKIPQNLRSEIEILRDFTGRKNNISNFGSCLATRYLGLQEAMKENETILAQISINSSQKRSLIEQAKKNLEDAQIGLFQALNTEYEGADYLMLRPEQVCALNICWQIKYKEDLSIFSQLTAAEVSKLLAQQPILAMQSIQVLENLEHFILFCIELTPARLEAFLIDTYSLIEEKFIHSPHDLAAILMPLGQVHFKVICQKLYPIFLKRIKDGFDLSSLLSPLSLTQRRLIFECLQDRLPSIIKSGPDFHVLFKYLTLEQNQVVLASLENTLPEIINNSLDFCAVLRYLTPDQRSVVFDALHDKLSDLIKHGQDLQPILEYLTEAQQKNVFTLIQDKLVDIFSEISDFFYVLQNFTSTYQGLLLDALQDNLARLVLSGGDFLQTWKYVLPVHRPLLFETLRPKFSELFLSCKELIKVLKILPLHLSAEFTLAVKDLELFKKNKEVIIKALDQEKRKFIQHKLKISTYSDSFFNEEYGTDDSCTYCTPCHLI